MKRRADGDTGASRPDSDRILADARRALLVMAGVIGVIWLVQVVNSVDHYGLSRHFGIVSREPSRLPDIFSAPFLHWSYSHIEANSGPLFFLGFLAAYRGVRRFVGVSLLVVITSGLGSWLFSPSQPSHTVSAGASGVVFGYFGYVALRGIVERHLIDVIVGLVVAVSYWSILQGVLPNDPHISWQAHLFGLIGGVVAALMLRERRAAVPGRTETRPVTSASDGTRAALHKELDDLGL